VGSSHAIALTRATSSGEKTPRATRARPVPQTLESPLAESSPPPAHRLAAHPQPSADLGVRHPRRPPSAPAWLAEPPGAVACNTPRRAQARPAPPRSRPPRKGCARPSPQRFAAAPPTPSSETGLTAGTTKA
jgi:hypothetical protein